MDLERIEACVDALERLHKTTSRLQRLPKCNLRDAIEKEIQEVLNDSSAPVLTNLRSPLLGDKKAKASPFT